MQNIEHYLSEVKKKNKELHYRFAKRLGRRDSDAVLDKLCYTEKNGRKYYSKYWEKEGVRKSVYIGAESVPEVKRVKEIHFLKQALKELEKQSRVIEACLRASKSVVFDPADVNMALPKAYRLTPEHLKEVVGPDAAERWYERAIRDKTQLDRRYPPVYPSGLTKTAKDGTRMRSKSEVLIANELINNGILFIYEMPMWIGGQLIHPDFMFYSRKYNKVIIWEHAGKLGDPGYMADFSTRMDTYTRGGLIPCVDIIFTFDTISGDIDARTIQAIIDEYC